MAEKNIRLKDENNNIVYPETKVDLVTDLTATASELNYSSGVTSNIQTQLNTITNTKLSGKTIICLTESEYAALTIKDTNTIYFVYEDE